MNKEEITKVKMKIQNKWFETKEQELDQALNIIEELQQRIDKYENPKDLTLMYMYCDEKAKDKIKELENRIDKAIEYINDQSPDAGVSGKMIKEILGENNE